MHWKHLTKKKDIILPLRCRLLVLSVATDHFDINLLEQVDLVLQQAPLPFKMLYRLDHSLDKNTLIGHLPFQLFLTHYVITKSYNRLMPVSHWSPDTVCSLHDALLWWVFDMLVLSLCRQLLGIRAMTLHRNCSFLSDIQRSVHAVRISDSQLYSTHRTLYGLYLYEGTFS